MTVNKIKVPVHNFSIRFREYAEWMASVGEPIEGATEEVLERTGDYFLVEAVLTPETAVLFKLKYDIV